MAKYIEGIERGQQVLFATSMEEMISEENEVRLIDAFVEKIDIREAGIKRSEPNKKGTNHFNPRDILKLYIYGYKNGIRSSRKLEKLCETNIEVMWLMKNIRPDFRTINEFRKENSKALKEIFKQLIMICNKMNLISEKISQDGTKIKAVNSKEKNYTLNKIDDRIKRIEEKIEKYMEELEENDEKESIKIKEGKEIEIPKKEELEERIKKYEEEKKKLKKYEEEIIKKKESQISLTDKEAKLMKANGKFEVCYNTQVLVEEKNHIVINYEADNKPADCGQMYKVSKEAKELIKKEIIINTTDKGYNSKEDMKKCIEEGIIPQVTLGENQEGYEIEIEYKEREIKEEERKIIKKCLEAGEIPEVYKEYLEKKEIRNKIKEIRKEEVEKEEISEEEIREYAMKKECFMKSKTGKVYCPMGEILRKKSKNKNRIKYCNKLACKNCKNPCTEGKYKEVVMGEDQIISTRDKELRKEFNKRRGKKEREKIKVVVYKLKVKEENTRKRMQTSEHIHGTMKRTDGMTYFLLKGKEKVNGELALYYCGSNLRRIGNILTVKEAIKQIKEINMEEIVKKIQFYIKKYFFL